MLETAVAIGHTPIAACELIRFRADAVEPALPPETTDLGLRGAPNFELLQLTRPDIILTSTFYTRHESQFAAIAPVLSLTFFGDGQPVLPRAFSALTTVATALNDASAGQHAVDTAEALFDGLASRARRFADRPVMLLDFGDARHFRAFGADSLYGGVLDRLGLTNAWADRTRFSFHAPVPLDRLADIQQARFVLTSAIPPEAAAKVAGSALWNALAPVRRGDVAELAPSNPFGGIPAALRFANQLVTALERQA